MLAAALEAEVDEFLARYADQRDQHGHRLAVPTAICRSARWSRTKRTKRTKGCGSRAATLTMVWKLALEAQRRWRRLMGFKLIPLVMEGREFVDGELTEAAA